MIVASDLPTAKDVVITLAGASAALAGLVLVFLGMVVSTIQGFDADTPKSVLTPHKRSFIVSLVTFFVTVWGLCLDVAWLVNPGGHALYIFALVLFGAAIFGIGTVAGALTLTVFGD